jgi:hypothetical protein
MSKVIPSKFMSKGNAIGVDSLSHIKSEKIRLQVHGNNSTTTYSPESQNKLLFRIPSFANSFLNTEDTFLSFKVKTTGCNGTNYSVIGMGCPVFSRVVYRSSQGLVISEENNFHILNRIFTIHSVHSGMTDEGVYENGDVSGNKRAALGTSLQNSITYILKFKSSLLDVNLASYLPLFMMDGGGSGHAFDVELTLAPPNECLRHGLGSLTSTASYEITEPVMNLNVIRMTPELCSKYNQIACNENEEITIPFKTFRNHSNSLTSATQQQLSIHEMATNIKRVWSVLTKVTNTIDDTENLGFFGSTRDSTIKIEEYNYKVGNQSMYSEPVSETLNGNNNITLNHVKGGSFSHGKNTILTQLESDDSIYNCFESNSKKMFHTVCSFDYSKESTKGVIQGISTSTPLLITLKTNVSPAAFQLHSFVEISYDLSIINGEIKYVEQKAGSNQVY